MPMQRRPLLETVLHEIGGSLGTLLALALGAFALYCAYQRRRRITRPPVRPGSSSATRESLQQGRSDGAAATSTTTAAVHGSPLCALSRGAFAQRAVCVEWSVLHDGTQWTDADAAVQFATLLTRTTDVYFLCHIRRAEDKRVVLQALHGITGVQRHKILFHTTAEGFVALTRQLTPALLVTSNRGQLDFLSSVLPSVVYVGATVPCRRNVSCVASLRELVTCAAPPPAE